MNRQTLFGFSDFWRVVLHRSSRGYDSTVRSGITSLRFERCEACWLPVSPPGHIGCERCDHQTSSFELHGSRRRRSTTGTTSACGRGSLSDLREAYASLLGRVHRPTLSVLSRLVVDTSAIRIRDGISITENYERDR